MTFTKEEIGSERLYNVCPATQCQMAEVGFQLSWGDLRALILNHSIINTYFLKIVERKDIPKVLLQVERYLPFKNSGSGLTQSSMVVCVTPSRLPPEVSHEPNRAGGACRLSSGVRGREICLPSISASVSV